MHDFWLGWLFGRHLLQLWHRQGFDAHGRQQLQGKGEAVPTVIDPVDKHLDVNGRALRFQAQSELPVRQLFALAKVFDSGFGARLVELARHGQAYMIFELPASYARSRTSDLNKSFSIYT